MARRVLITGGAGFIGSHLADTLLGAGYQVRALDSLSPQVHGLDRGRPAHLDPQVELVRGDIRDPDAVRRALEGVDGVCHLAAVVGVGQSMYELGLYTEVNGLGTALLLEALARRPVERLVVASSMSLYGEGLYRDRRGRVYEDVRRDVRSLRAGRFEVSAANGEALEPLPTPETKRPSLASVYALSKLDQEQLCRIAGDAYRIPTVALRLFNTYGPRQSVSNPYTGVLAIFASRLLNDSPPLIFEDGLQRRDFVSVRDVARAFRLALEAPGAPGHAFNIGSGEPHTVLEVARRVAEVLGKPHVQPEVTRKHRVGDIRHCFADIRLARERLGYEPTVSFAQGLEELAGWLAGQRPEDRVPLARAELEARGLTV